MSATTPGARWQAPGRVNLVGEHVDYNGGLVLPVALHLTTTATVSPGSDGLVHVRSRGFDGVASYRWPDEPSSIPAWARYAVGAAWAWAREYPEARNLLESGLDVSIDSELPSGAGLASSAAATCAVAAGVAELLGLHNSARQIVNMARHAENDFVGVPTGVMDQIAAVYAEPDHAVLLDCGRMQTDQIPFAPRRHGLALVMIDTGVRHSLADSAYRDRHRECWQAASELGVEHLADAEPQTLGRLTGDLRRRAEHVVSEVARVRQVADLLRAGNIDQIGAALSASHQSLRDDYEVSCPELDVTVETALAAGALGARMTGGGFGGNALVLCSDAEAGDVAQQVRAAYTEHGWPEPVMREVVPSAGLRRVPADG